MPRARRERDEGPLRRWGMAGVLALAFLVGPTAHARGRSAPRAEARGEARAAIREGRAAESRENFRQAAEAYLRADQLVPDDAVLERALRAAATSNTSVLVMYLAARAEERRSSRSLRTLARSLRRSHAARVGTLRLECGSDPDCALDVNGQRLHHGQSAYFAVGALDVEVHAHGRSALQTVDVVSPGPNVVVGEVPEPAPEPSIETTTPVLSAEVRSPVEPSPEPTPPEPAAEAWVETTRSADRDGKKWKPVVFWVGTGATVVAATAAVTSAATTASHHQRYLLTGSQAAREEGLRAQGRTHLLWGTTGVLAAATAVTGIFFTDWSKGVGLGLGASVHPKGSHLALEGAW